MTSNEVYIDVPRIINKEEVIIDLNQIRFEPRSSPTNDYTIGMSCFSAEHLLLRNKSTTDWLAAIRITYLRGETCLPTICFSELAWYKFN
jgi:hypothetical protein